MRPDDIKILPRVSITRVAPAKIRGKFAYISKIRLLCYGNGKRKRFLIIKYAIY